MNEQPARRVAPFARTTREALESVAAPPIAISLLARALASAQLPSVPEDVAGFRTFVDGPLRVELERALGAGAVTLVVGRLTDMLARADAQPLGSRDSGSRPVLRPRDEPISARRATLPAVAAPEVAPRPRSPVPMRREEATRAPRGLRPTAQTLEAMPRIPAHLPSCILVVSSDLALALAVEREISGRTTVLTIAGPAELARAVTRAGERVVVLVDVAQPSIDLATLAGLAPILPQATRVGLWGSDEAQRERLAVQLPAARSWIASGRTRTAGLFALALA